MELAFKLSKENLLLMDMLNFILKTKRSRIFSFRIGSQHFLTPLNSIFLQCHNFPLSVLFLHYFTDCKEGGTIGKYVKAFNIFEKSTFVQCKFFVFCFSTSAVH